METQVVATNSANNVPSNIYESYKTEPNDKEFLNDSMSDTCECALPKTNIAPPSSPLLEESCNVQAYLSPLNSEDISDNQIFSSDNPMKFYKTNIKEERMEFLPSFDVLKNQSNNEFVHDADIYNNSYSSYNNVQFHVSGKIVSDFKNNEYNLQEAQPQYFEGPIFTRSLAGALPSTPIIFATPVVNGINNSKVIRKTSKHLPEVAVRLMNDWYQMHVNNPYPTEIEKKEMARYGGITEAQVKAWFANKRNRTHNTRPKQSKKIAESRNLALPLLENMISANGRNTNEETKTPKLEPDLCDFNNLKNSHTAFYSYNLPKCSDNSNQYGFGMPILMPCDNSNANCSQNMSWLAVLPPCLQSPMWNQREFYNLPSNFCWVNQHSQNYTNMLSMNDAIQMPKDESLLCPKPVICRLDNEIRDLPDMLPDICNDSLTIRNRSNHDTNFFNAPSANEALLNSCFDSRNDIATTAISCGSSKINDNLAFNEQYNAFKTVSNDPYDDFDVRSFLIPEANSHQDVGNACDEARIGYLPENSVNKTVKKNVDKAVDVENGTGDQIRLRCQLQNDFKFGPVKRIKLSKI